ncbi:replicative DNA helicase [Thermodesulfovibrionales bacterium]|nr:replicative DNA helicase [Thermodesulfovibrionales bacterium]MCL0049864.1 replicative DNA helicase [Thermodesulfovibrionales bacterium]MCL0051822.1 replicative DNA helicase [Thermodesulfovibrionales bacterium]
MRDIVREIGRGMAPEINRLPPQNIEAEQSVLGAIILDNEALPKAIETLSPDDFYKEAHRRLYKSIIALFERNEPIDIVTLTDYLRKSDEIEAVGGISYLSYLANSIPTSANIRYHAKIVSEKSMLRALIRTATQITSEIYENSRDVDEVIDYAQKMIFDITDKRTKISFSPLKDVIKDTFKMIEHLYDKKEAITGVPSGFKDIDELTSGFQSGDLIIVGGRPGMGKTAFALNVAGYVAANMRETVAVFSLEMPKEQLALRMICAESGVNSSSVRKGFIGKQDWIKLTNAAGRLADAPIFIDDSSMLTVLEIRAKARRLKMEYGMLSLIVVDYLQLMRSMGKFERREQEISDISRSLKALAKELKVPVIALSQLNRAVEQRGEKRPTLADLRESGALEQDADVIIFLYRDEFYNKNNPSNKGKAELIVAKQRNGPTGIVNLTYLADSTKFVDFTDLSYETEEEVY